MKHPSEMRYISPLKSITYLYTRKHRPHREKSKETTALYRIYQNTPKKNGNKASQHPKEEVIRLELYTRYHYRDIYIE